MIKEMSPASYRTLYLKRYVNLYDLRVQFSENS